MAFITFLAITVLACAASDASIVSYADLGTLNPLPAYLTLNTGKGNLYCIKEIPAECPEEGEEEPEEPSCTKADILLVVDTSSSISPSNITELKNKLSTFAAKFPVSKEEVRFAGITFGSSAGKVFDFEEGSANVSEAQRLINRIPSIRGFTALHSALNGAIIAFDPPTDEKALLYKARYQAADVAKFVLVFTDGDPTEPVKASAKAAILKSIPDINIFAIGVGDVNMTQLIEIASTTDKALIVPDYFDSLTSFLNNLAETICELDSFN